ncbi:MAG: excinuclease ABC subunit UvrA [Candidatus Gracilibacteria bacterium]|nr:excinuclease ABC subunit UvrA [Candidatus Gracilibacteria bacterium]
MSEFIEVYGAKTHNLKNIDVKIPKNKMTVITGVSGSGKSSLAFNTIYNVGQQKYLESLSSYARMFIGGMKEEALVDEIKGLSPTISIDQKTTSKNPRSTVGTITEIYDYYRILFLNIGTRFCVKCNHKVKKDSIKDVIDFLEKQELKTKFMVKAPISIEQYRDYSEEEVFENIKRDILDLGFIRFNIGNNVLTINDDFREDLNIDDNVDYINIIVDRLIIEDYKDENSSHIKRLKDSLLLTFKIGNGQLKIELINSPHLTKERLGVVTESFSNIFICSNCSYIPEELTISHLSFNSHSGACQQCHGLGVKKIFLEEKIINPNLTLLEGAVIAPGFGGDYFFALLQEVGKFKKIELNTNYSLLSKKDKEIILHGTGDKQYNVAFINDSGEKKTYNSRFEGVLNTLERRYYEADVSKGNYDQFVVDIDCPQCDGHRLNLESLSVRLPFNKEFINIGQLSNLSVTEAINFFKNFSLSAVEEKIAKKVLKNATERLDFLSGVGLNYMTISRKAGTLSGGEAQRIRLATQIGTKLEGIIYVLDEPSIGLHPRDNNMLIENLKKLRDIGNTLIVVEHDEDIIREADHIIDVGPKAGVEGGNIIFEGTIDEIIVDKKSVTGPYLTGERQVMVKKGFRPSFKDLKKNGKILEIKGAKQNNLKNIDVDIPLSNLVVITGVSGSGKSSLVNGILAPYLSNKLNRASRQVGQVISINGLVHLDKTVIIDQSAIGKTPRSNPATYTGIFTPIRDIFAEIEESKIRGYTSGNFSFNTKSGRCDYCDGDGVKKVEMHFLPPVYIKCENCSGSRYNRETMQIKYKGKTISDVLNMTVSEAADFFKNHPKVSKILNTITEVGLGYIKLGQSSTTLSGGEAQRIKLSTELSKRSTGKTFYILDEPTTGLHFQDIDRLLTILHSLVDKGNTVLVIEHNMDVIINADHIIDIGPQGGDKGGELMVFGNIDDIKNCEKSYTGEAIIKYLNKYKNENPTKK